MNRWLRWLAVLGGSVAAMGQAYTPFPGTGVSGQYLVGSGGVTAGKLVKLDSTGLAVVTLTTSDTAALGIAGATVSSGGYVAVQVMGTAASCVFDGTTVIGDLATISTTVAGDCHDAGVSSSASLTATLAKLGVIQQVVTAGNASPLQLFAAGQYGTQSGGTTTNSLTFNNSGTGAASGATFNGSTAQTISYNTLGSAPATGSTAYVQINPGVGVNQAINQQLNGGGVGFFSANHAYFALEGQYAYNLPNASLLTIGPTTLLQFKPDQSGSSADTIFVAGNGYATGTDTTSNMIITAPNILCLQGGVTSSGTGGTPNAGSCSGLSLASGGAVLRGQNGAVGLTIYQPAFGQGANQDILSVFTAPDANPASAKVLQLKAVSGSPGQSGQLLAWNGSALKPVCLQDGTYCPSGGATANALTFATTGGAAPGTTFDGSAPITISPYTIGAVGLPSGTGFLHVTGGVGDSPARAVNLASNGSMGDVTGTVALGNGGTGQTTGAAAFNALYESGSSAGSIYYGGLATPFAPTSLPGVSSGAGTYVLAEQPTSTTPVAPTFMNLATYLASPPAIGGTAPSPVSATNLQASSSLNVASGTPLAYRRGTGHYLLSSGSNGDAVLGISSTAVSGTNTLAYCIISSLNGVGGPILSITANFVTAPSATIAIPFGTFHNNGGESFTLVQTINIFPRAATGLQTFNAGVDFPSGLTIPSTDFIGYCGSSIPGLTGAPGVNSSTGPGYHYLNSAPSGSTNTYTFQNLYTLGLSAVIGGSAPTAGNVYMVGTNGDAVDSGFAAGTANVITATTNATLVTLSALSLPYSQVTGTPTPVAFQTNTTANSSQGTYNVVNSTANAAGFSDTVSNTSGGTVKHEIGVSSASTARTALGLTANATKTYVANTTITVATTTVPANSCLPSNTTYYTVTMTGLATSNAVLFTPTTDLSGVTGWAGIYPTLIFNEYPSSGTLNYQVCNQTTANITPSSATTWNVGVI